MKGPHGPEAFDAFYRGLYGARWDALKAALRSPPRAVPWSEGLTKPYFLDEASVRAALALPLPEGAGGLVLDACAAPGGKTLILASRMAEGVTLVANELSRERRRRLGAVLDGHLAPALRERVRVAGFDAAAAGGLLSERGRFDAILLDAPCSSERHVLQSPAALSRWTPARPRALAARQWALLSSAFLLLKAGGSLVYATCALNPAENDDVVSRLAKKYRGAFAPDPLAVEGAERSEWGSLILPDAADGRGPMFIARIRKGGNGEWGTFRVSL
ncbi:MAG: hypothetical protein LBR16_08360, partial [Treponema sp.]|nr:hypothetical protein [Treponema sp.]